MSLLFTGSGRLERFALIPSPTSPYTLCGWFKLTGTSPPTPGSIFEVSNPNIAENQFFFGQDSGAGNVEVYLNWGTTQSTNLYSPGAGNWAFVAMVHSGTNFEVRVAAAASSTWDATWSTTAAEGFSPDRIFAGGNDGDEFFRGKIAYHKLWRATLSFADLLLQKAQAAPITTTDLLSRNDCSGTDLASALLGQHGGTDASFATSGSGISYDSDMPTFTLPLSATASGLIVPVQVDSVALAPAAPSVPKGSTLGVTATVLGSDGLPFEGISVALTSATTSRVTVSSSPITTDSAGESDFIISGVEVGTSVLTANADSGGATTTATATVSPVTSVATIQILEPLVVEAGESISVQVYATGTDGLPISGVSVTLASGTTGVATVASSPQNTAVSGIATFVLNGIAAGNSTLTATAASGAVVDTAIATVTAVAPPQPAGAQGSAWGRWIRGM